MNNEYLLLVWLHVQPSGTVNTENSTSTVVNSGLAVYTSKETVEQSSSYSSQKFRDFPDNPVVKTPSLQFGECKFHPWSGNEDPTCCRTLLKSLKKKKKRKKERHVDSVLWWLLQGYSGWRRQSLSCSSRLRLDRQHIQCLCHFKKVLIFPHILSKAIYFLFWL